MRLKAEMRWQNEWKKLLKVKPLFKGNMGVRTRFPVRHTQLLTLFLNQVRNAQSCSTFPATRLSSLLTKSKRVFERPNALMLLTWNQTMHRRCVWEGKNFDYLSSVRNAQPIWRTSTLTYTIESNLLRVALCKLKLQSWSTLGSTVFICQLQGSIGKR